LVNIPNRFRQSQDLCLATALFQASGLGYLAA
jgi:hypothetical protein